MSAPVQPQTGDLNFVYTRTEDNTTDASNGVNNTTGDSSVTISAVIENSRCSEEYTEALFMGEAIAALASISPSSQDKIQMITWDRLSQRCYDSPEYRHLHGRIQDGLSDDIQQWTPEMKPFFPVRHSLSTLGSVIMLDERPVIPNSLKT